MTRVTQRTALSLEKPRRCPQKQSSSDTDGDEPKTLSRTVCAIDDHAPAPDEADWKEP